MTRKQLKKGEIIEVEIIGLMEQIEKSWGENREQEEIDHNILVKLRNDESLELDVTAKMFLRNLCFMSLIILELIKQGLVNLEIGKLR